MPTRVCTIFNQIDMAKKKKCKHSKPCKCFCEFCSIEKDKCVCKCDRCAIPVKKKVNLFSPRKIVNSSKVEAKKIGFFAKIGLKPKHFEEVYKDEVKDDKPRFHSFQSVKDEMWNPGGILKILGDWRLEPLRYRKTKKVSLKDSLKRPSLSRKTRMDRESLHQKARNLPLQKVFVTVQNGSDDDQWGALWVPETFRMSKRQLCKFLASAKGFSHERTNKVHP